MAQLETSRDSWDNYFMHLAEESALRSKDPRRKVGACIMKDKRVLSLGYNGAPRSFPDEEVPADNLSDDIAKCKNTYMCHAELNAILNYRGSLSELQGSIIYVTTSPCFECTKALIQVGIKEIVYRDEYSKTNIINIAKHIAKKCNVLYRKLDQ